MTLFNVYNMQSADASNSQIPTTIRADRPAVDIGSVSAFSNAQELHDARTWINSEIDENKRAILRWKTRLNALTLVSRLPPEILCKIFILNIEESKMQSMEWVAPSQVCHFWREVALGCPNLWSTFYNIPQRWMAEMFRRSGNCSLDYSFDQNIDHRYLNYAMRGRDSAPLGGTPLVLDNLGRLRCLRLRVSAALAASLVLQLGSAAPALELLSFSIDSRRLTIDRGALRIPTLQAPNLRRLELKHLQMIQKPLTPMMHLTHLDIELSTDSIRPTKSELLGILSVLPALTCLILCKACPLAAEGQPNFGNVPTVEIQYLQHLSLSDSAANCACVTESISFPSSATLSLTCSVADTNDVQALLRVLPHSISHADALSWTPLTFWIESPHGALIMGIRDIKLQVFTSLFTDSPPLCRPQIALEVNVTSRLQHLDDEILIKLCKDLSVDRVHHIRVSSFHFPTTFWTACFRISVNVRSLYIHGAALVPILAVMENSALEDVEPCILPHLQSVTLDGADFAVWYKHRPRRLLGRIRNALMYRSERGLVLQDLEINEPLRFSKNKRRLLEELVINVRTNWEFNLCSEPEGFSGDDDDDREDESDDWEDESDDREDESETDDYSDYPDYRDDHDGGFYSD